MDDDHVLDAAFAWLDVESLLRAAAVCRRWRQRATRDEAWRGRGSGSGAEVGWARGLRPRDVLLTSLNVATRWRRGRVTTTELARGDARWLCADGDWLAYREAAGRFVYDHKACAFLAPQVVRIHDAASARTAATLPVDAHAAAVSLAGGRCATLRWDALQGSSVCDVWTASADDHHGGGGGWGRAATLAFAQAFYDVREDKGDSGCGLQWQNDALLVYGRRCDRADGHQVCAEWLDAGTGALRPVARRPWQSLSSYDGLRAPVGRIVPVGASAFLVTENAVYALDPRADTGRRPPPLLKWQSGPTPRRRFVGCDALDDGRHIAVRCGVGDVGLVELWDVRAARAGAVLRVLPCWTRTLCATARGTVLLWTSRMLAYESEGGGRYRKHRLVEWDTTRGTAKKLLAVKVDEHQPQIDCMWADERRAVMSRGDSGLYVLDATARAATTPTNSDDETDARQPSQRPPVLRRTATDAR